MKTVRGILFHNISFKGHLNEATTRPGTWATHTCYTVAPSSNCAQIASLPVVVGPLAIQRIENWPTTRWCVAQVPQLQIHDCQSRFTLALDITSGFVPCAHGCRADPAANLG